MNNKAIINGQEYTLLEILPLLDGGQQLILCEDGSGKSAVCSELLWYSCALKDAHSVVWHGMRGSNVWECCPKPMSEPSCRPVAPSLTLSDTPAVPL